MALLQRVSNQNRISVKFTLNSRSATALVGDTILTAILVQIDALRFFELDGSPRAGFCLMGACQDCWVVTVSGDRFRSCTTMVFDGLDIRIAQG